MKVSEAELSDPESQKHLVPILYFVARFSHLLTNSMFDVGCNILG